MTKYVTQGEREMVEAVVGGGLVCECGDETMPWGNSGLRLGRPASTGDGLVIHRASASSSDQPLLIRAMRDGSESGRTIDFDSGSVLVKGERVASRPWVLDRIGRVATGVVSSVEPANIGGVVFTWKGDGVYEYTQTDKFVATFYPRTASSQLPSNWSHAQTRHTGFDNDSNQIMQVRCVQDNGDPINFEVAVYTTD